MPDGKIVRFAIDAQEFPNFSWRGFVVFSPIQDEIVLNINIHKSAVYRLLLHYRNPTKVPVEVEIKFIPVNRQTQGMLFFGVSLNFFSFFISHKFYQVEFKSY